MEREYDPSRFFDKEVMELIERFLHHILQNTDCHAAVTNVYIRYGYLPYNATGSPTVLQIIMRFVADEEDQSYFSATELLDHAPEFYELVQFANSRMVPRKMFNGVYVPTVDFAEQLLNLYHLERSPAMIVPVTNVAAHFIRTTVHHPDVKPTTTECLVFPHLDFAMAGEN